LPPQINFIVMVKFDVYKPAAHLISYINSYTFVKGRVETKKIRPLPNGSLDMIFYFSAVPEVNDISNKRKFKLDSFIGGTLVNPMVIIDVDNLVLDLLAVSFSYLGFIKLFGIPQINFRNTFLPLEYLGGKEIKVFIEKLNETKPDKEKVKILDTYFSKRYINSIADIPASVKESVYKISLGRGNVRVQQLIEDTHLSERAFERNFKYYIGLTCKEFINTIRFSCISNSLSSVGYERNWYDLVEEFGYYDQSHFIHDLKKYTGMSPQELLNKYKRYQVSDRLYLSQDR